MKRIKAIILVFLLLATIIQLSSVKGDTPTITTNDATGIGLTDATLWGTLTDDGGENCTVGFEYGLTTAYGTKVVPLPIYFYVGGLATKKVYQYWQSNMTKKAETVSYGGNIYAIVEDTTYIYVGGATINKVYQYWKSNMTKKAETASYGGTIAALAQDDIYIYAGGYTTNKTYQYWKSNMTKKAETADYEGENNALTEDDTYIYAGGFPTDKVCQYWKSNMTKKSETTSYGASIQSLTGDDTYVYAGGYTKKVYQYWKSNMTKKAETTNYGDAIYALANDNDCIYAGGFITNKVYQYWKSNMTKKAETASYGGAIYVISATPSYITGETFFNSLTGLTPGTTYHYRAYANNSAGGITGDDKTFETKLLITNIQANPSIQLVNNSVNITCTVTGENVDAVKVNISGPVRGYVYRTMENGVLPEIWNMSGDRQIIKLDDTSKLEGTYCVNITRPSAYSANGVNMLEVNLSKNAKSLGNGIMPSQWQIRFMVRQFDAGTNTIWFELKSDRETADVTVFNFYIKPLAEQFYLLNKTTSTYFSMPFEPNRSYLLTLDDIHFEPKTTNGYDNYCDVILDNGTTNETIHNVFFGLGPSGAYLGRVFPFSRFDLSSYDAPNTVMYYIDDWTIGNLTTVNVSMTPGTGDTYYYNDTYNVTGLYNFFIWANDTSDNAIRSSNSTFEIIHIGMSNEDPGNGTTNIPISQPTVSVNISSDQLFNWTIGGENITTNSSIDDASGIKQADIIGPLDYATEYTWWVNASYGETYINNSYSFTTIAEPNNPPVLSNELPVNGSTTDIVLDWYINITDPDYDLLNWTIQCSNGMNSNGNEEAGGTKALFTINGLSLNTTYTIWVNATDGKNWTRAWYTFITRDNIPSYYSNENPVNGSIGQPLSFIWSINITDDDGDVMWWSIECSNGDMNSSGEDASPNATISLNISGLSYLTEYTVWVNTSDYYSNTNEWFTFTTISTYNHSPDLPYDETPVNGTNYKSIYDVWLNVSVSDPDGDMLDAGFFYGNGTHIVTIFDVLNSTRANCSLAVYHLPYTWVSHDTTYYWYVTVDDGIENVTGPTWDFHTSKAWDLNEDRHVNYLDISLFVSHYGLRVIPPGEYSWDINEDTYTNYLDVSLLVSHYGESY